MMAHISKRRMALMKKASEDKNKEQKRKLISVETLKGIDGKTIHGFGFGGE
jgi:hypothetical protein